MTMPTISAIDVHAHYGRYVRGAPDALVNELMSADAVEVHQRRAARGDRGLQFGFDLLELRIQRDEVGDLFGGHSAAGLAGDVTGSHGGEHGLGLGG